MNKLGVAPSDSGVMTELPVPGGGGPAFCIYSNGRVYYSLWARPALGEYDVLTGRFTEYAFPIANEPGGPMWRSPTGEIVIGTRNVGYILVFNPAARRVTQVPAPFPTNPLFANSVVP